MKKVTASTLPISNPPTTSKSKSAKSIPKYEETEAYITLPPDGGWGWVVVFATFYTYVIIDGAILSFGLFLNKMAKGLNCSKSDVSLAAAIQTCFYCLSGPFSAALVNRFGFRSVAVVGCLTGAAACALTSISEELYQVILAYGILGGIGFGLIYLPCIIVVGFYFERWRALASGISLCGGGIGGTILPPVLTMFLNKYDWRDTFRIISLMILSCVFSALLFRPIRPIRVRIEPEGTVKRTLSHISEVQETKSKMSQFFIQYNNAMYPTVADVKTSVIALLRPPKLTMTRSTSSEIMATTLMSDDSYHTYTKEGKVKSRCSSYYDSCNVSTYCYICCRCYKWECSNCCTTNRQRKMAKESNASSHVKTVEIPSRPMYRDDIFYIGSVTTLPEYRKSQISRPADSKSKSVLEYHISVTRTTTHQDVEEQGRCQMCPEAVKRTLATMLDFRLLKSPSFLLLVSNAICAAYAFYTPFVYIKDRALQNGVSPQIAFWLISAIGCTNTVGRILCGILSSFPSIHSHMVCAVLLLIGGVWTILSGISFAIWAQFLYAAVYGLSVSSISTLRSVIIVEMLGLDKLTNAVGMILLFQGVASLAGTALSGVFRDMTGDYRLTFYVTGAVICLGAIFLVPIRCVSNLKKNKKPDKRTSRA